MPSVKELAELKSQRMQCISEDLLSAEVEKFAIEAL